MKIAAVLLFSFVSFSSSLKGKVRLERLADGFHRPVDLQVAPGNKNELFVVEQNGKIHVINRKNGKRKRVFLDLTDSVSRKMNEEGLLSLAFSPDFEKDRRFYVNFTDKTPKKAHTHISRFLAKDETTLTIADEELLLSFEQDFRNHNGGWISFGPDGYLYIGNGDGGKANDPHARAQDLESLLGKLLRIDVSSETGYRVPNDNPFLSHEKAKPEIFAFGLRNPWRCSFDSENGDLWIADVGQFHYEEVNHLKQGEVRGRNFGWREREGTLANPEKRIAGEEPEAAVIPVYEYTHGKANHEGLSITGGFVYRGSNKSLKGKYLFADYVTRRLWTLDPQKNYAFEDVSETLLKGKSSLGPIASFGQDHKGEGYIVDHSGVIWRIK